MNQPSLLSCPRIAPDRRFSWPSTAPWNSPGAETSTDIRGSRTCQWPASYTAETGQVRSGQTSEGPEPVSGQPRTLPRDRSGQVRSGQTSEAPEPASGRTRTLPRDRSGQVRSDIRGSRTCQWPASYTAERQVRSGQVGSAQVRSDIRGSRTCQWPASYTAERQVRSGQVRHQGIQNLPVAGLVHCRDRSGQVRSDIRGSRTCQWPASYTAERQVRSGQVRSDIRGSRTCQWPDSYTAGRQVRSDQVRSSQVRSGQVRSGRVGSGRVEEVASGQDRYGGSTYKHLGRRKHHGGEPSETMWIWSKQHDSI